jgi:hypothetical protein
MLSGNLDILLFLMSMHLKFGFYYSTLNCSSFKLANLKLSSSISPGTVNKLIGITFDIIFADYGSSLISLYYLTLDTIILFKNPL